MLPLVKKVVRALRRDRTLPVSALVQKVSRNAAAYAVARMRLRTLTKVGPRARCFGRPHVDNEGVLEVGADFAVSCTFGTVHLATGEHGTIEIGDDVTVNYGTAVSAKRRVKIGSRVKIGPYCVLADTELPLPLGKETEDEGRPIEIGDDVWLAGRVTVLPGVRIGHGAVVAAGSVVTTDIPDGAIASGVPAKVLRAFGGRVREALTEPMSGTRLVSGGEETAERIDVAVDVG